MRVINPKDYALAVFVGKDGTTDVFGTVTHPQVPALLRQLAESFEEAHSEAQ